MHYHGMIIMNNFNELRTYIRSWQIKYDKDFKPLPIDEHSSLVFNHKNEIIKFVFSNERIREECRASIPSEYLAHYQYVVEQINEFIYYSFI